MRSSLYLFLVPRAFEPCTFAGNESELREVNTNTRHGLASFSLEHGASLAQPMKKLQRISYKGRAVEITTDHPDNVLG